MLWVKAFHIIAMVCWFSGLFYLPRLFVYHREASDPISLARFKVMERKLFYFITKPAMLLTIIFGAWLMSYQFSAYMQAGWMHIKLTLVALLIVYTIYLGRILKQFAQDRPRGSSRYYRIINEVPALFLIAIVILVVVKPF